KLPCSSRVSRIERNLQQLKGRASRPGRCCLKITGRPIRTQITRATSTIKGLSRTSAGTLMARSSARLPNLRYRRFTRLVSVLVGELFEEVGELRRLEMAIEILLYVPTCCQPHRSPSFRIRAQSAHRLGQSHGITGRNKDTAASVFDDITDHA